MISGDFCLRGKSLIVKMSEKIIFTIGSSNRQIENFLDLLRFYGIEVLIDVRRFPVSKFDYFRKKELSDTLAKNGIDYFYLGKELGGYRRGGYENYIESSDFRQGLQVLEEIALYKKVIIMCSEKFAWKCHRKFIGYELMKRGWQVIHIIDKGKEWKPKGLRA